MKNTKAHMTAISRTKPSKPMQILEEKGLLKGKLLDYGCGKGFDAKHYSMDKYDPGFFPKLPRKKYHTLTCNYVLNVILPEKEQEILDSIKSKLRIGGVAYISVRRDIKKEGYTNKGTYQRNVILDLPVLHQETNKFCIYILKK